MRTPILVLAHELRELRATQGAIQEAQVAPKKR